MKTRTRKCLFEDVLDNLGGGGGGGGKILVPPPLCMIPDVWMYVCLFDVCVCVCVCVCVAGDG